MDLLSVASLGLLPTEVAELSALSAAVELAESRLAALEAADADGDSVANGVDAFPNDATETTDSDSDGTGDNADAFPNDATETTDSDSDGTGDNADQCDSTPSAEAGDINAEGCGASERDTDGDGVNDNLDFAPLDDQTGGLAADSQEAPGSADNPYLISSLADLEGLSAVTGYWASGVYLRLTQDIDASNTSTWNVGDHDNDGVTAEVPMGFLPIGDSTTPFKGALDGAGHVISNLFIQRHSVYNVGLFGVVDAATIENVGLTTADITGTRYVGGLAGRAINGSAIRSTFVTGSIVGVTENSSFVGGLVGYIESSSVQASYATSSVTGQSDTGGLVGGVTDSSTVTGSYATGAVSQTGDVGGLVGYSDGVITDSYWNTETSGQTTGVGLNEGTGDSQGLTSTEMLAQSSFAGFAFAADPPGSPIGDTPWVIVEGATQPYLYWQDDDGDGLAAYLDPDDDGDGVDDASDDYPLEAAVSLDTDGDGLADDWNAGCDPKCKDASGLTLDGDDDNDGVADGEDTDPLDPKVCRDVDNDLADDCSVGTDGFGPLDDFNPSNDGLDTDGDGLADVGDPDDDNDLVDDGLDACPSTPSQESVDAQGCSETQKDDDGDGVNNATDSCPDTASAEIGLVSTGGCGPSERDTDGDGTNDNLDAFPNDPNETLDSDGDGYGDNEETEAGTDPNDADDQPIQSGLPIWLLYEASKP
jgi:hypothetical protein